MRTLIPALAMAWAIQVAAEPASPRICYLTPENGYWQVVERRLDGTGRKVLTRSAFDKKDPVYHPDGRRIFYSGANRGVYELDIRSRKEKEIHASLSGIRGIRFSRDGKRTLFYRARTDAMDQSEIWLGDPSFKVNRRIIHRPGLQRYPDGNADFTMILYLSGQAAAGHNIWLHNTMDSSHVQVTKDHVVEGPPRISPSGKWGVFPSAPTGKYNLYLVDLSNASTSILVPGDEVLLEMDWVDDHRLICVLLPEGQEGVPALVDVETKQIVPLDWKEENGFRSPSVHRP